MKRNNIRKLRSHLAHITQARVKRAPGINAFAGMFITMFLLAGPAHAQFAQAEKVVNWVQITLATIAVSVLTSAIMWAGFKVMSKHERFMDQLHILGGGILIGGAAAAGAYMAN